MKKVFKVYLAGGMRGNWQDQVIEAVRRQAPEIPVIFIDPRNNGTKDEQVYTAWDLEGVAMADILFTYIEANNPAGHGACLEIGYAKGLTASSGVSKVIITAVAPEHPQYRYFGMARVVSDEHADNLNEAIQRLVRVIQS
jgi:hypothetical protein